MGFDYFIKHFNISEQIVFESWTAKNCRNLVYFSVTPHRLRGFWPSKNNLVQIQKSRLDRTRPNEDFGCFFIILRFLENEYDSKKCDFRHFEVKSKFDRPECPSNSSEQLKKKSPGASTTPEVLIFGVWLLRRAKKNRFHYFRISNWPNWDEFQLQGLITSRRFVLH